MSLKLKEKNHRNMNDNIYIYIKDPIEIYLKYMESKV